MAYEDGSVRFSNLNIGAPASAFGYIHGIGGSLYGNSTNDFVDRNGVDWMNVYPGQTNQADYAFAQTRTVQSNESLFTVDPAAPLVLCDVETSSDGDNTLGCLGGGANISLINVEN